MPSIPNLGEDDPFPEVLQLPAPPTRVPTATWVKSRRPPFKIHTSAGLAKTAITTHTVYHDVALYEQVGPQRWQLVRVYPRRRCRQCDGRVREGDQIPEHRGRPPYEAEYLCYICRRQAGTAP